MSDPATTIDPGEIGEAQAAIEEDFALFDDVRDKIEYIIDLGKDLPPLPDAFKTEGNRVRGCQSQVWLVADLDPVTRRLSIRADSDAVIVKGLISLLLRIYADRTPEAIATNPPEVFERVGLGKMLTPGRANGLYAMVKRIRQLAIAYKTAETSA